MVRIIAYEYLRIRVEEKKFLFLKTVLNYATITCISSLFGRTPSYVRTGTDIFPGPELYHYAIFGWLRGKTNETVVPFFAFYVEGGKSGWSGLKGGRD
jgi:hypothetical protein